MATYHTLPSPPPDFTGRADEIADLVAHFSGGESASGADGGARAGGLNAGGADASGAGAAFISGIRGMGGVGKTALALVVAHRLATSYPDAALIFECQPAGQRLDPDALLANVLHVFEPAARLPEGLDELQALCRQALAGRRGILLLDNAADAGQVRPLLPPPPGWAVLVTSRARFPLPGARLADLHLLSEDESVALLIRLLGDGGRADLAGAGRDLLAELARWCGRLPLALRLAAGFLTTYSDWPLDRYLAGLAGAPLAYLKVDDESVSRVLSLSYESLRRDNPALAAAWQTLAVFPAPFDRAAGAAALAVPEPEARPTLSELVRRNMLEYDQQADLYDWHDLLRECAAAAPEPEGGWLPLWLRHAQHYLALGRAADDLYLQGGEGVVAGLAAFDAIRPHLSAAWLRLSSRAEPDARRWLSDYPDALADVVDLRLSPRARIPLLETALAAARQLSNRGREGNHLGNLGLAYWALGDTRRAIRYYEQALAVAREMRDRRGEAADLGNLGNAYADLGDARRAIWYHEQRLAIAREIRDRRGEGYALGNLGNAYADLDDTRRAIGYYEQALAITREIGDRRAEGNVLGGLGSAYADLGDDQRAIGYHKQRLTIARKIGDRRGEGNALGNLGVAYKNLGDARRAIGYYKQDLAIRREIGDRRGEANAAWNLGLAYEEQGKYARAAELMQVSVDFELEIGHPEAEEDAKRLEEVRRRAGG